MERNDNEKALRLLVDAIVFDPQLNEAWIMLNDALEAIGIYKGRYASNDQYLTEGGDVDYKYYTAYYCNDFNTMGLATEFIGQPEEAFKWYKKSLAINPNFDLALFNIGLLSARLGIAGNAELAITKLTGINPQLAAELEKNLRADTRRK
jgi:tetratricopeptide (TPR) repeat protein